jgi:hypothetical protein
MANTQRDPKKEAFWRDAIRRQAGSGLSVRVFCRRHRLSEPSLYERRRTFQERDVRRSAAPPAFVPVIVRDDRSGATPSGGRHGGLEPAWRARLSGDDR